MINTGDNVIYTDEHRIDHLALVTMVWSIDCINLVHMSKDDKKTDDYGRQIERVTSVGRKSETFNSGRHFVEIMFTTKETCTTAK